MEWPIEAIGILRIAPDRHRQHLYGSITEIAQAFARNAVLGAASLLNPVRPCGTPLSPIEADQITPPAHIAILDAAPGGRTLLSRLFTARGYETTGASTSEELAEIMHKRQIDLVLLDIDLPDESGFEVCADIRRRSHVPMVIISARGQETDRVVGLDLGADDYIVKPFGHLELLARVRAVLRRVDCARVRSEPSIDEAFSFAGWTYRPSHHQLIGPSGAEVELTSAEHQLLITLLRHPGRVIGRERLLELTRSRVGGESDRSIDVLISRLRRKLTSEQGGPPFIRTVRGVGYMLATNVDVR